MGDDDPAIEDEDVPAAQRVLPVRLREVTGEGFDEEAADVDPELG